MLALFFNTIWWRFATPQEKSKLINKRMLVVINMQLLALEYVLFM